MSKLIRKEKCDNFNVVGISINVIALEQIFFVWRRSYLVEEPEKILELSMSVSCDDYWRFNFYNNRLLF